MLQCAHNTNVLAWSSILIKTCSKLTTVKVTKGYNGTRETGNEVLKYDNEYFGIIHGRS